MLEDGRDQGRAHDLERARLVGQEFGLGAVQKVLRNRKFPVITGAGALLIVLVVVAGLPVVVGVAPGPYTTTVKTVVAMVTGGLR